MKEYSDYFMLSFPSWKGHGTVSTPLSCRHFHRLVVICAQRFKKRTRTAACGNHKMSICWAVWGKRMHKEYVVPCLYHTVNKAWAILSKTLIIFCLSRTCQTNWGDNVWWSENCRFPFRLPPVFCVVQTVFLACNKGSTGNLLISKVNLELVFSCFPLVMYNCFRF